MIVDSATALYRTDFNGRGELSARQSHLGKFLRTLQRLADEVRRVICSLVIGESLPFISSLVLQLSLRIRSCQIPMVRRGLIWRTRRSLLEGTSLLTHRRLGTSLVYHVLLRRLILLSPRSVQLKKGRGANRQAKIYDSPCLPESESTFAILNSGIGDPEEE